MNVNKQMNKRNSDQTTEKLIESALNQLVKKGYRGAVTREIALGAGVTEMTLFRHFRSKDELFAKAINQQGKLILSNIPEPSGDKEADLLMLSTSMIKHISSNFLQFIRIIPELEGHIELKEQVDLMREQFSVKFISLINYYKNPNTTYNYTDEMAFYAFIGPIFFFSLEIANISSSFDCRQHVKFFLKGLELENK